mgnify:CR=1 FL=1
MLRFFSKMRYKLAAENRPAKYVRYAIGEILLVVIGILIALQVNNWNEERKEAAFERKVLNEIITSIGQNINYLNRGIDSNNDAINSCRIILNYFDKNLPYSDSLDRHFSVSLQWFYPSIQNNAYESLKSSGLHLIKSDSIRDKLGGIYEWKYMEILNQRQEDYFYGIVAPVLAELFESYEFRGPMKPYNYDELKESNKYKHIIRTLKSNRELQNQYWEMSINSRLDLAKMIEQELNK